MKVTLDQLSPPKYLSHAFGNDRVEVDGFCTLKSMGAQVDDR
jgi:hypothetical protein